jgi:hypothetical protein
MPADGIRLPILGKAETSERHRFWAVLSQRRLLDQAATYHVSSAYERIAKISRRALRADRFRPTCFFAVHESPTWPGAGAAPVGRGVRLLGCCCRAASRGQGKTDELHSGTLLPGRLARDPPPSWDGTHGKLGKSLSSASSSAYIWGTDLKPLITVGGGQIACDVMT